MAGRKTGKKAGRFTFDVVSESSAREELAELRSGRGGRTSKYEPLATAAQDLSDNKVLKVRLEKNDVGGLRGYLRRRFDDKFVVKSSKVEGTDYLAYVQLAAEEA